VPEVVLTASMIFSIWFGNKMITASLLLIFLLDTLYSQGKDMKEIFPLLKNRILKTNEFSIKDEK